MWYRVCSGVSRRGTHLVQVFSYVNTSCDFQIISYFITNLNILSKSESVKFSLIQTVICIFTDSPVKRIFSTVKSVNFDWFMSGKIFVTVKSVNFAEVISEIWLIRSNLFLTIWISQILLIISRFWLIQI